MYPFVISNVSFVVAFDLNVNLKLLILIRVYFNTDSRSEGIIDTGLEAEVGRELREREGERSDHMTRETRETLIVVSDCHDLLL